MTVLLWVIYLTAIYYVVARADITRFLWEPLSLAAVPVRTARRMGQPVGLRLATLAYLGRLLECPACSGFWLGIIMAHIAPPIPHACASWYGCVRQEVECGLLGLVGVALLMGGLSWALRSSAVLDVEDGDGTYPKAD